MPGGTSERPARSTAPSASKKALNSVPPSSQFAQSLSNLIIFRFRYVMKLHLKPASEWPKRPTPLRQFRKMMLRWEVEDASTPHSDDDSKETEE